MALKDAGVTRAKVGPDYLEVEFTPEASSEALVERLNAPIAPPTPQLTADYQPKRPGYASLLPSAPRFTPADE